MRTQSVKVPGGPLAAAIARNGDSPSQFAARSGVAAKTQSDWRKGVRDATWGQADAALVALGLHWWDVWPPESEGGKVACGLWEGEPALVVACAACGLEDARVAVSAAVAVRAPCSQCGGAVHVVVDVVAA